MIVLEQRNVRSTLRTLLIAGLSLSVALLLLLVFDLVRLSRAPSVGMLVSRAWPQLPLLALLPFALFGASAALRRWSVRPSLAKWSRRVALGLGVLVAVPLGVMMVEVCIYDPIKFSYLIWRVEDAVCRWNARWQYSHLWGDFRRIERRDEALPVQRPADGAASCHHHCLIFGIIELSGWCAFCPSQACCLRVHGWA